MGREGGVELSEAEPIFSSHGKKQVRYQWFREKRIIRTRERGFSFLLDVVYTTYIIYTGMRESNKHFKEQGRIHGYPSRVRVGRGSGDGYLGGSGELKKLINAEKVKWGPTNRPKDRQSGV